jgi:hypothetical protein
MQKRLIFINVFREFTVVYFLSICDHQESILDLCGAGTALFLKAILNIAVQSLAFLLLNL